MIEWKHQKENSYPSISEIIVEQDEVVIRLQIKQLLLGQKRPQLFPDHLLRGCNLSANLLETLKAVSSFSEIKIVELPFRYQTAWWPFPLHSIVGRIPLPACLKGKGLQMQTTRTRTDPGAICHISQMKRGMIELRSELTEGSWSWGRCSEMMHLGVDLWSASL